MSAMQLPSMLRLEGFKGNGWERPLGFLAVSASHIFKKYVSGRFYPPLRVQSSSAAAGQ